MQEGKYANIAKGRLYIPIAKASISKVSIEELTKKIMKPLFALIAVLLLITYVPIFTTIFLK